MIKTFIKLYLWAENIWFKFPQKLRFLLVGGFNTVFAYAVFFALYWLFSNLNIWDFDKIIVSNAALVVQYFITINLSFITMRYYVFQSHGNWKKELLKAWSVYVSLLFINAPVISFLIWLGIHPLLAQALYLTFSTIITFLLHKYYSFRKVEPSDIK